jgi:hypothetical protein
VREIRVIHTFNSFDWNALREICQSNEKYPYICITGNRVIATDGHIVFIKKMRKSIGKLKVYIHKREMTRLIGDHTTIKVKITDKGVWIRFPSGKSERLKDALQKIKFPAVKKLSYRETNQRDSKVTIQLSRSTLTSLLNVISDKIITLTIHEDTLVAKWKTESSYGYISQVKLED